MRGSDNYRRDENLNLRRRWRFVEGNPVNDGVIFWISAVAYDLAVKILSDTSAGGVLYRYRIDETFFAESCVSPLNECGHALPAISPLVSASFEPTPESGRTSIRVFQRGNIKVLVIAETPDDE